MHADRKIVSGKDCHLATHRLISAVVRLNFVSMEGTSGDQYESSVRAVLYCSKSIQACGVL